MEIEQNVQNKVSHEYGNSSQLSCIDRNNTCSEQIFGEQVISECENSLRGQHVSHLTLMQYQNMSIEQKKKFTIEYDNGH